MADASGSSPRFTAASVPALPRELADFYGSPRGARLYYAAIVADRQPLRPPGPPEDVAPLLTAAEATRLREGDLWYVDDDLCALLEAAHPSMPTFAPQPHDLPSRVGFAVFAEPVANARSATQRNRYPNAHATHEQDADLVVEAIDYTTCATAPPAVTAVRAALARLGKPYVWGAAGPNAFDCSGLTRWAWAKASIQIPRTSDGQYADAGPRVPPSRLQPGDLLFFSNNGTPSGIHHVGMYLGKRSMIDAPRAGENVRIVNDVFSDPYYGRQYIGATVPVRGPTRRRRLTDDWDGHTSRKGEGPSDQRSRMAAADSVRPAHGGSSALVREGFRVPQCPRSVVDPIGQ